MPDQYPSDWTPAMIEYAKRLDAKDEDGLPADWTPAMKAEARKRLGIGEGRADTAARQKQAESPTFSRTVRSVLDQGIENAASNMGGLGLPAGLRRRFTEPGTLTRDVAHGAPIAAGTAAGGWPGVAIAAGTGAASQSATDALDDKPQSLSRIAIEGAKQGGLNAIAPIANAAAPLVSWLAKTGLSKLAGTSKVGAGRLLETRRAPFTKANAESVRSTIGQAGAPSEGTAVQFENAVARANRPVTTVSNENPLMRFTPTSDWQAVRLAKWANANKAKVGSYAAQGAHNVGNTMEGLGGQPALVARLLRELLGGQE